MNTNDFIQKQLELIKLEKDSEIAESKNALETSSLISLQDRGLCLLKLRIASKSTGLYGRTLLTLQTAVVGRSISTQNFSTGDIVSLSQQSVPPSDLLKLDSYFSATVTKVTATSVVIALDSEIETQNDDLNDDEVYKIIKLSNEITYKRMKNALDCVLSEKLNSLTSHLADIIFYKATPSQTQFNEKLDFYNKNLDFSQQDAINFSFKQKELAIIHGPPGTGKTTTLIEIIKQSCLKYNQKILCCAPSNIAVDNLIERLIPFDYGKIKIVRLGHPARLLEHIQDYSLDSVLQKSDQYELINDIRSDMDKVIKSFKKCSSKGEREGSRRELRELRKELYTRENKSIKQVLESANCVFSTINTAHVDGVLKCIKENHFDLIIIDECSQALEAGCWVPLMFGAKKLILAGDHLQLPPTIISKEAANQGLDKTLMKRLIDHYGDECTQMLKVQYRMNKSIMNWISKQLYESKLQAHKSVAEHLLCELENCNDKNENTKTPIVLIDTDGCEMDEMVSENTLSSAHESKANEGEAKLVLIHITQLINSGIRQDQIAVISPYNLQVELIRTILNVKYPQIEVKSVDGFQGREKEAIILSLVRSNKIGEVGFLADERRINVAITRARRHLCVICDTKTCKNNKFLKSFLDYCDENADKRSGFDYENQLSSDLSDLVESFTKTRLKYAEVKIKASSIVTLNSSDKQASSENIKKKNQEKKKDTRTQTSIISTSNNIPLNTVAAYNDKTFEDEVTKIIESLNEKEYIFPASLNARERRIVHELSENYKINHLSVGENEERRIKISKIPFKVINGIKCEKNVVVEVESETDEEDEVDVVENRFRKLNVENIENKKSTIKSLDEIAANKKIDTKKCSHCFKDIQTQNYTMHELQCQRIKTVSSASANKSKVKKNKLENANTDDFDELVSISNELNSICNYIGCKIKVQTLGQNCSYCRRRFCFTHSLAEIHGCGDAAKIEARSSIKAAPKPVVSNIQKIRHNYSAKKLNEKIEKLKSDRKPKKE